MSTFKVGDRVRCVRHLVTSCGDHLNEAGVLIAGDANDYFCVCFDNKQLPQHWMPASWLEAESNKQVPTEDVCALPNGFHLFRKPNGVGGFTYHSDEIPGGVEVWDTDLVDKTTLLAAIVEEDRRVTKEYHEVSSRSTPCPVCSRPNKFHSIDDLIECIAKQGETRMESLGVSASEELQKVLDAQEKAAFGEDDDDALYGVGEVLPSVGDVVEIMGLPSPGGDESKSLNGRKATVIEVGNPAPGIKQMFHVSLCGGLFEAYWLPRANIWVKSIAERDIERRIDAAMENQACTDILNGKIIDLWPDAGDDEPVTKESMDARIKQAMENEACTRDLEGPEIPAKPTNRPEILQVGEQVFIVDIERFLGCRAWVMSIHDNHSATVRVEGHGQYVLDGVFIRRQDPPIARPDAQLVSQQTYRDILLWGAAQVGKEQWHPAWWNLPVTLKGLWAGRKGWLIGVKSTSPGHQTYEIVVEGPVDHTIDIEKLRPDLTYTVGGYGFEPEATISGLTEDDFDHA